MRRDLEQQAGHTRGEIEVREQNVFASRAVKVIGRMAGQSGGPAAALGRYEADDPSLGVSSAGALFQAIRRHPLKRFGESASNGG